jgi:hypothetical protein
VRCRKSPVADALGGTIILPPFEKLRLMLCCLHIDTAIRLSREARGGETRPMAPIPDRDYHRLMAQIQYQQRCIAALEAENSELQRRLNDLKRGIGISVTVQGQTMTLTSPITTVVSQATEPVDPGITGIFPSMDAPHRTPYPSNQSTPTRPNAPPPRPVVAREREVVTPPWLRDQPPEWPTLNTPHSSAGHAAPRGAGLPPESPPPDQFSTLAKLTGHHPAVNNGGDQRQYPHRPSAYSDSFVLG